MRNRAVDVDTFVPSHEQKLLLDANVWLLVLGLPSGLGRRSASSAGPYSAALKRFRKAGAKLLIDAIVMSEVVNRSLRERHRARFQHVYPVFKDFRQSKDFGAVGTEVAGLVREILRIAELTDTSLGSASMDWIAGQLELGGMDFNDAVLVQNCAQNDWTLVTHDGDITEGGIDVVTANRTLLVACPA